MTPDELRRHWRRHFALCRAIGAGNEAGDGCPSVTLEAGRLVIVNPPPPTPLPAFPDELRGMTCGAKNRRGEPCKRRDLYANGRCRLHGGLSSGPRTPEGRAKALGNLKTSRTP